MIQINPEHIKINILYLNDLRQFCGQDTIKVTLKIYKDNKISTF